MSRPLEQDVFSQLLQRVDEQHRREVEILQTTVTALRLRSESASGQPWNLNGSTSSSDLDQRGATVAIAPVWMKAAPLVTPPVAPRATCSVEVQVDAKDLLQQAPHKQDALAPSVWSAAAWSATATVAAGEAQSQALVPEPRADMLVEAATAADPAKSSSAFACDKSSSATSAILPKIGTTRKSNSFLRVARKGDDVQEACGSMTPFFEMGVGFCVFLNMIIIFLRLEYIGYQAGVQVGIQSPGKWPNLDGFFAAMQHTFCIFFVIELGVRLAISRYRYFYNRRWEWFNILDAVVVTFALIETYVLQPLSAQGGDSNLSVVRALRLFRCLRALRIFRTFEMFSKLRVLVSTVLASFFALFWSMCLLFITMLIMSVLLCELVTPYIEENTLDHRTIEWMYKYYGTAGRSLWTVFELTFSGGWPNYVRRLVEEVNGLFAFYFAIYVSTVIFAMTRIISALFLKETLNAAAEDAERTVQKKLTDIFSAADTSGDGKISLDEFQEILAEAKVRSYLSTLGLETDDPQQLFRMLDNGDGGITADEFMSGASKMKGAAKNQDMKSILSDFKHLEVVLDDIHRDMEQVKSHPAGDTPA